jgi:hypothetical protein
MFSEKNQIHWSICGIRQWEEMKLTENKALKHGTQHASQPIWRQLRVGVRGMEFNASTDNISAIWWRSVLLVEETVVPAENHWPVASHWQTITYCCIEYTSPWERLELTTLMEIGTDCTGSCISNYHLSRTTMASKVCRQVASISVLYM